MGEFKDDLHRIYKLPGRKFALDESVDRLVQNDHISEGSIFSELGELIIQRLREALLLCLRRRKVAKDSLDKKWEVAISRDVTFEINRLVSLAPSKKPVVDFCFDVRMPVLLDREYNHRYGRKLDWGHQHGGIEFLHEPILVRRRDRVGLADGTDANSS